MANIVLTNFGDTTLSGSITSGDLTAVVTTGGGALLPALTGGNWFYLVLEDVSTNREIVKVTARVGDVLTIERAQEGTTARAFSSGDLVSLRLTVQAFADYVASVALTTAGAATLQNKVLDNTNTITVKDANFTLQDDADATKQVRLQLSGLTTGVTRTLTVPDNSMALAGTDVAQNFTLPQRSALLTDNDGNFDLAAKQNFKCTTSAGLTLTFTNQADGLSGSIVFINASNHAIAAHANTKLTTSDLTKLSATGTYRIDYMTDGTNALCSVVGPYA